MRREPFAMLQELLRRRQFSFSKRFRESFLHAVIINGPDIGAAKIEKQQHLHSPTSDAPHLDQTLNNFFVAHSCENAHTWHGAVDRFCGQILNRSHFAARQTGSTQFSVGRFQDHFRIKKFSLWIKRANPPPNCGRGFAAELLVGNRFGQRVEWPNETVRFQFVTSRPRDEGRKPWICRRQMFLRCRRHALFFSLRKIFCSTFRFRFGKRMSQTQLTWYGQSAFKIVTPVGNVLLIDPWLTNPKNPNGKADVANLKRVDMIFLTHGHSDHVGDSVEIAKKTGAKLFAQLDLAAAITTAMRFPEKQAQMDTTPHFGGEVKLLEGDVTATLVPAVHASGLGMENGSTPPYAGEPAGVVIAVKNGPTLYHTGDTDVFSDMRLIGEFSKIDIMMACIGDHFTMGPMRAVKAVKLVGPRMTIPMHYATFPVLTGTPEAFAKELKKGGAKTQLRVMKVGETITV
jgi:L-ascorbate metabolism protein UlaG (beta-lactamase superfamily)